MAKWPIRSSLGGKEYLSFARRRTACPGPLHYAPPRLALPNTFSAATRTSRQLLLKFHFRIWISRSSFLFAPIKPVGRRKHEAALPNRLVSIRDGTTTARPARPSTAAPSRTEGPPGPPGPPCFFVRVFLRRIVANFRSFLRHFQHNESGHVFSFLPPRLGMGDGSGQQLGGSGRRRRRQAAWSNRTHI